jgi:hypothetical protein
LASNQVLGSAVLSKLPAASAVPLPNGEPSAVNVRGELAVKPEACTGNVSCPGTTRTQVAGVATVAASAAGTMNRAAAATRAGASTFLGTLKV